MSRDARAVSNVLGIVLLFAIVIGGTVLIVTVGATALDDTRQQIDTSTAEKMLTQFDSKSAMVALGGTDSQATSLPAEDASRYRVRSDTGWMNVTSFNESSKETKTIANVSLGKLAYQNDGEEVSYQGGGVWKRTESGATMVSPPEFHFRGKTLTLPIVNVNGDADLDSRADISKAGPSVQHFPNSTADGNFTNPLEVGSVNVTVQSEYYEAWGRFFGERTEGNVTYDHTRKTAQVELTVPFDEAFDQVMATTELDGISPEKNRPDEAVTGISYPSMDQRIEDQIDDCNTNPSRCKNVSMGDTIDSAGVYYTDNHFSGPLDIDNPGDDVTIVVDENFDPGDITINSNHNATIYVRNEIILNGDTAAVNDGGDAGDLTLVMHSDGAFNNKGKYKLVGLLYAPGSDCTFNGGAGPNHKNIVGGAVCETATINGNKNSNIFDYDSGIRNPDIDIDQDVTPLTYLHVTSNPVNVTSR